MMMRMILIHMMTMTMSSMMMMTILHIPEVAIPHLESGPPAERTAHAVRGDHDGVVNVLLRDHDGADGDGGDDGDDFQNQVTTSGGWQQVLNVIECRSVR